MAKLCLYDIVDLDTAERHQQFARVVSEIFVQDWIISGPDLTTERMWVAEDSSSGVSITRGYTQPMQASCLNARAPKNPNYFVFTSTQPYRVVTADNDTVFGAGEIVLLSNTRACSVISNKPHQSSAFIIQGETFNEYMLDCKVMLGQRLSSDYGACEPLRQLMKVAWEFSERNEFATAAPHLIKSLMSHLVLLDLLQRSEHKNTKMKTAGSIETAAQKCREQVKRTIDKQFREPDFNLASIAADFDISARYIQQCFAMVGETASDYLRRKRVLLAATMLQTPSSEALSMTDMAFACGFNSPAYFATEFKRCFGVSPTTFKKMDTLDSSKLEISG